MRARLLLHGVFVHEQMNKAPKDLNQFMNDCALPHEDGEDVAIGQGAHDNSCFLSISFGRVLDQKYFKLESDWRNSYLELLSKVSHHSRRCI